MNEIKKGLEELHNILKDESRFISKEFTNEFIYCIEAQSGSKALSDICRSIISQK